MKVAVYCSSYEGLNETWQESARKTGQWIGEHGGQLVYGGISAGLMHVVAKTAKDFGATIIGVIPARKRAMVSPLNDSTVSAIDLSDRKRIMQSVSDIFVVLPGGYGTIDEFCTTFTYLNFTRQNRPMIVHNPDGVFDLLLAQLRRTAEMNLMAPKNLEILTETHTIDELIAALNTAAQSLQGQ